MSFILLTVRQTDTYEKNISLWRRWWVNEWVVSSRHFSTDMAIQYHLRCVCTLRLSNPLSILDPAYGGSEPDVCRRIEKARSCMKSLDRNIWRSSISLQIKIRLYNVYILPILLYGADTWNMTVASSRRLDAFDQWYLRRIVHIPCTAQDMFSSTLNLCSTVFHF